MSTEQEDLEQFFAILLNYKISRATNFHKLQFFLVHKYYF